MAKAYTQDEFDELMLKVQKVDMRVAEYLDEASRDRWARVYAIVNRGGKMTSNIAECINKHLLAARELPICDFLEEIEPSTEFVYTVHDGRRRFIINLSNKTCNCRMSQLDEIPCPHAWAVIKQKHLVVDYYCSDLFKPETVVKTYDIVADPLLDECEWKIPKDILDEVVLLPRYKRSLGRPKKRRDKPLHELMAGKKKTRLQYLWTTWTQQAFMRF
ncbi:uncharacterized protein LOC132628924 [Lycium barbarum]|uniref:uncharacterized protein LOC132628924 n=1 Tax=Lycium barbarum TaxID=112863 RepID=UPI00293E5583|nr:uncharacterized protein LOC132628924 [Lycium barbarum]